MDQNASVGQAVRNMYGTTGYIYEITEAEGNTFCLSAGMSRITKKIKIVYPENSSFSEISEHDFPRWKQWAGCEPDISPELLPDIIKRARESIERERIMRDEKLAENTRKRAEYIKTYAPQVPAWAKAVLVAELRINESDIQTDYFAHSVGKTLILGFSKHTRDLFSEMAKAAGNADETAHMVSEHDEHREKYSMGGGYYLSAKGGSRYSGWVIRKISLSSPDDLPSGEWRVPANGKPAPKGEAVSVGAARIEEHTHTKHGFQMFIVIFPRVEREEYDRLLGLCREAGGWYSRKWGKTPGGFAFKDRAKAEAFAANANPQPTDPTDPTPPKPGKGVADRLREIAEKMQPEIDDKFRDRQTNTPKRLAQAEHARMTGQRLQRTQAVLRALADRHDAGTVPAELLKVRTKSAAYDLMAAQTQQVSNGYHGYHIETGKPYYQTPEALSAWALLEKQTPEQEQADKLRRLAQGLQFSSIPGYFPTPAPVITQMIELADIRPEHRVREPEAGHGAIADAVRPLCAEIVLDEVNYTLSEILTAKGYNVNRGDFLEVEPDPVFDRVLMNPPFERLQDVDHVRHAYKFLKLDGGRLVAVMSAGVFYNSTRKASEFRDWIAELGGDVYDLPDGAFKESGTGVSVKLLVLNR